MKRDIKIVGATLIILSVMMQPVYAESLFRASVSQEAYGVTPRPLYGAVTARSIGDLITIVIEDQINTGDELTFSTAKGSSTVDNFSTLLNKILPGKPINSDFNNFGGSNTVSNSAKTSRKISLKNTITAQVMQILPNGNFIVQGRKSTINGGETVNVIVSGVVDPRFLNSAGQISSNNVANLQMAITGKGTVSRSDQDGPVNKVIKYMF